MFRPRQMVGKYRVLRKLASGGFSQVYAALDTVEGIPVALKVPHPQLLTSETLQLFRQEARMAARLDHPNILPLKTAGHVGDHFLVVCPLGERTLDDRLKSRLSLRTAMDYTEQMLAALAHAHERRILHCDVKPDNFVLFPGNRLRLADFGLAKVALRTMTMSGGGTVGYMAPEQALGRPTIRSDVFSLGLILYQMFSLTLPRWPFTWPPPGHDRLRRRLPPAMVSFIRKAIEVDERRRYRDAVQMLAVFRRIKPQVLGAARRRQRSRQGTARQDWRQVRIAQFLRSHRKDLPRLRECTRCQGPVAEPMSHCPWCGDRLRFAHTPSAFPAECPRCHRGVKLDWRFCPWCYGGAIGPGTGRQYTDRRYSGRCAHPRCARRELMPFMRYCPWCRAKVQRPWRLEGSPDRCPRCRWGDLPEFWEWCPWCGHHRRPRRATRR